MDQASAQTLSHGPTQFLSRSAGWFVFTALAAGTALLLAAGPAAQLLFPSDDAAYLDACHRVSLGQWPGRDFLAAIGPAAMLPTALAMKLGGATVDALVIGSAGTWLAFGTVGWFALRSKLPPWLAACFALFVAATAAAPYPLDFGQWNIHSYGMLYNRLAWATLCIAAGATLLPRRDGQPGRGLAYGLGACAVGLWLLKPNYLLVLLPLVAADWLATADKWAWLRRALLGGIGLGAVVWVLVPFSAVGYVENHLGMARSVQDDFMRYTLIRTLRTNVAPVAALGVLYAALFFTLTPPGRIRLLSLTVTGLVVATLATNLTNCQFGEIPVWGALGWIGAGLALAAPLTRWRLIVAVGGVLIGLAFTWQPAVSIAHNFAWKKFRSPGTPAAVAVNSPAWRGMGMRIDPTYPIKIDGPLGSPANYALWLNDGLALLARVQPTSALNAVVCLDWTNPFPFATQTTPPAGDDIAWHVGRTMGPDYHPSSERILRSATVVMEPRRSPQPESLAFKRALFAPELERNFVLAGETEHWRAWVRRS